MKWVSTRLLDDRRALELAAYPLHRPNVDRNRIEVIPDSFDRGGRALRR